jgi:hypothetical protein
MEMKKIQFLISFDADVHALESCNKTHV